MQRREIHLGRTKSGSPRVVPLPPPAVAQIGAQSRHLASPWVWWHGDGARYTTIKTAWTAACRRAGVEGCRWHDLRHTFATWALRGDHDWQAGPMEMYRLQRWLGHSGPQMTQRYAHLVTENLHRTIDGAGAQNRAQDRVI